MLFFFPRSVLDEILNLIESVSGGFPSYFSNESVFFKLCATPNSKKLAGGIHEPLAHVEETETK